MITDKMMTNWTSMVMSWAIKVNLTLNGMYVSMSCNIFQPYRALHEQFFRDFEADPKGDQSVPEKPSEKRCATRKSC